MLLFNSLTRSKSEFVPIVKQKVRLYVCGVTPYDTTHIGHAFTYICFDVLARYLRFKGYDVTYIQNVTDIDDSILERARQTNDNWRKLGDKWTKRFLSDMKKLHWQPPSHYVKATDSIPTIIKIVKALVKDGFAYEKEGNVYFNVTKDKEYGKLSQFTKEQMLLISKERGNDITDKRKKNPLDFVLWIKSNEDEPKWDSPWSKGRPGWHIECTAMNIDYLGEQIDIHGGGRDLIFPHHESEIAQMENYTGKKPFSTFWLHTAMVLFEGEKMSKSLGNLVLVEDLLKKYSANTIRWYLLSHQYRKPWEFIENELGETQKIITKIEKAVDIKCKDEMHIDESLIYEDRFRNAMDDDVNTPKALEIIRELASYIISSEDINHVHGAQITLRKLLEVLGFNFNR